MEYTALQKKVNCYSDVMRKMAATMSAQNLLKLVLEKYNI